MKPTKHTVYSIVGFLVLAVVATFAGCFFSKRDDGMISGEISFLSEEDVVIATGSIRFPKDLPEVQRSRGTWYIKLNSDLEDSEVRSIQVFRLRISSFSRERSGEGYAGVLPLSYGEGAIYISFIENQLEDWKLNAFIAISGFSGRGEWGYTAIDGGYRGGQVLLLLDEKLVNSVE